MTRAMARDRASCSRSDRRGVWRAAPPVLARGSVRRGQRESAATGRGAAMRRSGYPRLFRPGPCMIEAMRLPTPNRRAGGRPGDAQRPSALIPRPMARRLRVRAQWRDGFESAPDGATASSPRLMARRPRTGRRSPRSAPDCERLEQLHQPAAREQVQVPPEMEQIGGDGRGHHQHDPRGDAVCHDCAPPPPGATLRAPLRDATRLRRAREAPRVSVDRRQRSGLSGSAGPWRRRRLPCGTRSPIRCHTTPAPAPCARPRPWSDRGQRSTSAWCG